MTTFQAEGTITRTWLSTSNLVLAASTGYYIQRDGFGPGEVTFRKNEAESPYVAGKYLTHAVKDQQTSTLKVRVLGTSQSVLYTRMEALAEAVEQFSFTLTLTINGTLFQYECDASDYSVGDSGSVQDLWLRSDTQIMTIQIPHKPKAAGFI